MSSAREQIEQEAKSVWAVKTVPLPPRNVLMSFLSYNPDTGVFIRARNSGHAKAGDIAGSVNKDGGRRIRINGYEYLAARLAWKIIHGTDPAGEIDHINRDRADDRISNLREASRSQNQMNKIVRKTTMSGVKGVTRSGVGWRAVIKHYGNSVHLGTFSTKEQAGNAYKEAAKKYHGEYANA